MRISARLESAGNLQSTAVPTQLNNHVLVRRSYFYTLPTRLLKSIANEVGRDRFDVKLLALDFALSEHVGDHAYSVGVFSGHALNYHLLGDPKAVVIPDEIANRFGWSHAAANETAQMLSNRLDALRIPGRGYVGWLMANREFLDAHDDLFRRNRDDILRHGIPKPVIAKLVFGKTREGVAGRSNSEPFIFEFRDFCHRWRLQTFAGPYLPMPLEPQIPDLLSKPEGLAAAKGITTNSIPDIFPVSGRSELQSAVDDAVHSAEKPSHLAGWYAIIDSSNNAKNQIHRYGRLFQFQHFVRVLYSRHAKALNRKKTHVLDALGNFFEISKDSVKADWKHLDDRVGKDWNLRADPLA